MAVFSKKDKVYKTAQVFVFKVMLDRGTSYDNISIKALSYDIATSLLFEKSAKDGFPDTEILSWVIDNDEKSIDYDL